MRRPLPEAVDRPDAWMHWDAPAPGEQILGSLRLRHEPDGWWVFAAEWACGAIGPYMTRSGALEDARRSRGRFVTWRPTRPRARVEAS